MRSGTGFIYPEQAITPITAGDTTTLDGIVTDRDRNARAWIGYCGHILAAESMTLEKIKILDLLIAMSYRGEDLS